MSMILLVEDETLSATSLSAALSQAGFYVHRERVGRRAIAAVDRFDFDAAIVAGGLPDLGDGQVAQELRARDPELAIFVCTGFDEEAVSKWAIQERMLVLEKPLNEAQLIWLLQAHVGSLS